MSPSAARAVELARIAGENVLTVFGAALVVLLLTVGIAWWVLHRYYVRRLALPNTADARVFVATLAFGFFFISLAVALFVTLPGWIVGDSTLTLADQALTDAIRRSVSLPVLKVFAVITGLADTPVLWVLAIAGAAVLTWRREYLLACVWVAAIAGNGIVTRVLKTLVARARPVYEHELLVAQGWSFPSGHSSGAVAAYGVLAYVLVRSTPRIWHLPIVLAAAAIAFITGCSRIFLQVHFASDVVAGFASGLAWLAVCIIAAEAGRRQRKSGAPLR